jgi:hypothetical protein
MDKKDLLRRDFRSPEVASKIRFATRWKKTIDSMEKECIIGFSEEIKQHKTYKKLESGWTSISPREITDLLKLVNPHYKRYYRSESYHTCCGFLVGGCFFFFVVYPLAVGAFLLLFHCIKYINTGSFYFS